MMKYVKVKDKLVLLMLVCIISNIIVAIFSIDYLRKMEWHTEQLYENKMKSVDVLKSAEALAITGQLDEAEALVKESSFLAFDSKMEFYMKQIGSKASSTYFQEMKDYVMTRTAEQIDMYENDIHKGYMAIVTVSAVMVLLVCILSYVATKSVRQPTQQLKYLLKRAQQGDFSNKAKYMSRDELGELLLSYNQMVTEVKDLLDVVNHGARAVNIANNQLAENSKMMTFSADQIANNSQVMTAAITASTVHLNSNTAMIQEVASGIAMITNRMQTMKGNIGETVQQAQIGERQVSSNVSQMQVIERAMIEMNTKMHKLEAQSKEISKVIDIIQAIANDTNLLALNAAIEAARAGEYGKGFGVVANEVKKLANQSLHSTETITNIIKTLQTEAKAVVEVMDTASIAVHLGIETTDQTAQNFRNIASRIQRIGPHIEEVSVTIEQMAHYTKDVAKQSMDLTHMSEENVSQIEQISHKTTVQLETTTNINREIQNISKNTRALTHALNKFTV